MAVMLDNKDPWDWGTKLCDSISAAEKEDRRRKEVEECDEGLAHQETLPEHLRRRVW